MTKLPRFAARAARAYSGTRTRPCALVSHSTRSAVTARLDRRAALAPIGEQLVERARLEDGARHDVRADGRAFLDDADRQLAAARRARAAPSRHAVARPAGPAPITTTSNSMLSRDICGARAGLRRRSAAHCNIASQPSLLFEPREHTDLATSAARCAASNMRRFIAANRAHLRGDDYAALYDWSIESPAEFWAAVWHFCEVQRAPAVRHRAARRGAHAGRQVVRRREAQLRGEPARARRDRHGARVRQRARRAHRALVARAARASRERRRAACARSASARRPRRRLHREPPRSRRRDARDGEPSAPSGRRARRTSASTPCSTASGRSSRRCCSRPTAISTTARASIRCRRARRRRAPARARGRRHRAVPRPTTRPARAAERDAVRRAARASARSSATSPSHSTRRSTFSTRRARRACRSASCTASAARCCSIARSTCCTRTSGRGDVVFYFTTCGWMMWNWLVSALASRATLRALRRRAAPSRSRHPLAARGARARQRSSARARNI